MHPHHEATEPSRHKCLIYDGDPSEQLPVVVPLLMDGLRDNWRCVYLGSPEAIGMVSAALEDHGVDTRRQAQTGALLLSADRSHLVDGTFEPQAMIDSLCASIEGAVRDGFGGLCATGDMRWELGADGNFDRLLEYEALLEQVFRDRPLRGICQYHRDFLPQAAIRDALLVHQSAYLGGTLNRDNLFYIPPELLLNSHNGRTALSQGDWMCSQILRVMRAEESRDRALAEQTRLAEQLAALNRDLERRVAERTRELEIATKHLQAFSYSVSHDLRAPLRAIRGFGDILAEDFASSLGEDGLRHLDRVRSNAVRMEELIESLLEMGRAINAPLRRREVDLSALAGELVRELRRAEPARSVEVVIQAGLAAAGDEVLLRAVMTNLISNAWKFTSKREHARIEIGRSEGSADGPVFFVRDNGSGFDMEHAAKLFGVFQRLHRQDEFPGHGVGLATVERIVSRHGGRTWAEARVDEGATLFFTLPANG